MTLLIYWRAVGCGFLRHDDEVHLTRNAVVQRGLDLGSLSWAFDPSGQAAQWIPLTWLVHMLNVEIFGMNPAGHHFVNVLIHLFNVVLLFLVLRRATGQEWPSACVAAFFALHPLHVESVAWVAELKDVLSAFFWILTMGAYVLYSERPSAIRYAGVLACFALGLLAKPMLVTLPFALLLFAYWPLRRRVSRRRLLLEVVPLLALALAASVLTYHAQRSFGAMSPDEYPLPWRIANAVVAYGTYLAKTLVPVRLAAFYPHEGAQLAIWKVIASAVALALISAIVFWQRKRPYLPVGWLWFLGTLIPTIGLVQIGEHSMADRFTYIPHIGLFMMLVWGAHEFADRRWFATAARKVLWPATAAVILTFFSGLTWIQIGYWRDTLSLFGHTLAVTGPNFYAENNYAQALLESGRHQEAAGHFTRAIALNPGWPQGYSNLGTAFLNLEQPEKAVAQFETALRLLESQRPDPRVEASVHQSLGLALLMLAKAAEARQEFEEAVRLDPDLAAARYSLGKQLEESGDYPRAIEQYREALRIDPGMIPAQNNLAVALYFNGDYAEAWNAVKSCRALGFEPAPGFLKALGQKMPEP